MPIEIVSNQGLPLARRRWVYYTGLAINATKASRTSIGGATPTQLKVGHVLVMDPYGYVNGVGADYTQPKTNYLSGPKVVVVQVPNKVNDVVVGDVSFMTATTNSYNKARGGLVEVEELNTTAQVMVASGQACDLADITKRFLGVADGSFALTVAADALANQTAMSRICAVTNETFGALGADTLKSACFGPLAFTQ